MDSQEKLKARIKKFLRSHRTLYPLFIVIKTIRRWQREALKYANPNKNYRNARKNLKTQLFPSLLTLKTERERQFDYMPLISIIAPLYNTPVPFLEELIASVKAQTYGKWELCLADGSNERNGEIQSICETFIESDERIKYKKLDKNSEIAEKTNANIAIAQGDYLALVDYDDMLHPSALFHVVSTINETGADFIYTDELIFQNDVRNVVSAQYKPDFGPDTLNGLNYICHFACFSRDLCNQAKLLDSQFDGSQDFDFFLKLSEHAKQIVHIPRVLYFWRRHESSVASGIEVKPYAIEAGRLAVEEHVKRQGHVSAEVFSTQAPGIYRVSYPNGIPLVSILVPNKDHASDLDACIGSILSKSTYENYEIIIIENNSTESETFSYYEKAKKRDPRIKVVTWEREFNYPAINNFGIRHAKGDYFLLLNNDTTVITPDWIQEMLMFAQRRDVGAVGALLYYGDDTVQHAGMVVGIDAGRHSYALHAHRGLPHDDHGYWGLVQRVQNVTAVTGACMMVRRSVYEECGGLDENLPVAFNDIDFCLAVRKAGYLNVYTPYAQLYHYESKTRGYDSEDDDKQERYQVERDYFYSKWAEVLEKHDPYWNPNLDIHLEEYSFRL